MKENKTTNIVNKEKLGTLLKEFNRVIKSRIQEALDHMKKNKNTDNVITIDDNEVE